MFLEYRLSISKHSIWEIASPTQQAMRLPFALFEWGYFIAGKSHYTRRIGAEAHLIYATVSGCGLLEYDGEEKEMEAGSIAVISCRKEHFYRTLSEEPWGYKWVYFGGRAAEEYIRILNPSGVTVFKPSNFSDYLEIIDSLGKDVSSQELLHNLSVSASITQILTMLCHEKLAGNQEAFAAQGKMQSAIAYMQENYAKKVTIDEMARAVYLSKYHFIRIFKNSTGLNPYEYLTNLRIARVKQLLNTTSLSLEEIAEQTGFGDSKTLIRNFKKIAFMTPGKYRKASQAVPSSEGD